MELGLNQSQPTVMHIDLNSCFAMVEQQANPLLRHKPVAVTNRLTPGATIIAASYEAKACGIGVGTRASDARVLAPDLVVLETDPPKYTHTYHTFFNILRGYSPDAYMKSIDEGAIDFSSMRLIEHRSLPEIGQEIKARLKDSLGEWMTCNVGVAPNRFLAKLAAGLNKPDGLNVIDHRNLRGVYAFLGLRDLPGINYRYERRLNMENILNPLDFLDADLTTLSKRVFKSINGYHWYRRLRGWEADDVKFDIKTVGKQYVLHEFTNDLEKLAPTVMKLCEMMGRRLRGKGLCAYGLFVGCLLEDHSFWHQRQKFTTRLYATSLLYKQAMRLLNQCPGLVIKNLSLSCYDLAPADNRQPALFETYDTKQWRLSETMDKINNRYGEFSVVPARMANMENFVANKIPFGSTRYFGNS